LYSGSLQHKGGSAAGRPGAQYGDLHESRFQSWFCLRCKTMPACGST
jgi:hypothetical protein